MGPLTNELLGIVFVVLAATSTFLMFYLWGFPFDKDKLKSEAPRPLMLTHRVLGYLYLIIYVYLMIQMLPRLWTYQVELPARTVAHLLLGMAIGAVLLVKVAVVRFFKHLEGVLAPILGTFLFVATVLLIGMTLPNALREHLLRRAALQGENFSAERLQRVRTFLPITGLQDQRQLDYLASTRGLMSGRTVLRSKCVQCHDLRTILARPRTPENWRQTVERMAQRSTLLNPITESDEWEVTAYLIAVTPTLQQTVQALRQQQRLADSTRRAVEAARTAPAEATYDAVAAEELFRTRCSQCHGTARVAQDPPGSAEEAAELVARMVENGLVASEAELTQIIRYVTEAFVQR